MTVRTARDTSRSHPADRDIDWSRHLAVAFAVSGTVVLIGQIVLLLRLWYQTYHPLPWHDEWNTIELLRQLTGDPWRLDAWFSLHNEHRLVVPRIVFALDFWMFGGRHLFTFAVTAVLACAIVLLALRESRRIAPETPTAWLLGLALASMLMCGQQASNLLWAFQVQWFLVHFFTVAAVAAVVAAARASEVSPKQSHFLILGAVLAALCANYSTVSGNLAWISTGVTALLLRDRLPKWTLPAVIAVGAASIAAYAYGFRLSGTGTGSLETLRSDPLAGAAFLLALFGVPLAPFGKGVSTAAGGFFAIASLALCVGVVRTRLLARTGTEAFSIGLLAFVACVGVVTAAGRVGLGIEAALESRLASVVAIGWASLTLLCFARLADSPAVQGKVTLRRARVCALISAAVCLTVGVAGFLKPPYDYLPIVEIKRSAESAIVAGAADSEALERVGYPEVGRINNSPLLGFLRSTERSVFSGPALLMGRSVGSLPTHGECIGGIDSVEQLRSGGRVSGWAATTSMREYGSTVLLVDAKNVVAGIGFSRDGLVGRANDSAAAATRLIWRGHSAAGAAPQAAFLVAADGRSVCPTRGPGQPSPQSAMVQSGWPGEVKILFAREIEAPVIKVDGLSFAEPFGRWSNAKLVVIRFDRQLPPSFEIDLVLGGYAGNVGANAQVLVGPQSRSLPVTGTLQNMQKSRLQFSSVGETDLVSIIIPVPTVPRRLNPRSADERALGLVLQSMTIRPQSAP